MFIHIPIMEKEILQRYIEGNVTPEEINRVIDWLDKDEKNVQEFMAMHKVYDISILNKQYPFAKNRKNIKKISLRTVGYELLKITAIFFLFWSANYFIHLKKEQQDNRMWQTVTAPAGQRAEVVLPDGSHIWLNAKTSISYPERFNNNMREVHLNGEAFFDIAPHKKIPFQVKTEKVNIKVLGTEFNVSAYDTKKETLISLLSGSIELEIADSKEKKVLNPGQTLELNNGSFSIDPIAQYDYFKWKEGILCFDESVSSLFEKLELYFDTKILSQNETFFQERYTGKFRLEDGLEHILKVLQLEHKFTYTRDREQNRIIIR